MQWFNWRHPKYTHVYNILLPTVNHSKLTQDKFLSQKTNANYRPKLKY